MLCRIFPACYVCAKNIITLAVNSFNKLMFFEKQNKSKFNIFVSNLLFCVIYAISCLNCYFYSTVSFLNVYSMSKLLLHVYAAAYELVTLEESLTYTGIQLFFRWQ